MSQQRDKVEIDGSEFEVKLSGELSLEDHATITRAWEQARVFLHTEESIDDPFHRDRVIRVMSQKLATVSLVFPSPDFCLR